MPISYYPNDPYKDRYTVILPGNLFEALCCFRSNWPVGPGQLTSPGKRQHYQLGQWMRVRYIGPMVPYSPDMMTITSIDMTSCWVRSIARR